MPFTRISTDDCAPTPPHLHFIAFFIVSSPLCFCAYAVTDSAAVVAACAALVGLPRLLCALTSPAALPVAHTAALAVYWNLVMAICFLSPIFLGLACYARPPLCACVVAWLVWTKVVHRPEMKGEAAPWREFAECEWGYHAFRRFLSLRLHIDDALRARPPEQPVIIGVHPHGIASDYRILMDGMLYSALPGRPVLTLAASVLFHLPLVRELCVWTRCIDASKPVAERALRKRNSLMIIVGGEAEQIGTRYGIEEVVLQNRYGFVKLALAHGCALVPVYCFGCVDCYWTWSNVLRGPREALRKRLGVCLPLYAGSFGVLPLRVPLDMVFGAPLELTPPVTPGKPTEEEVAMAHAQYIAALVALFNQQKSAFGYAERELSVK